MMDIAFMVDDLTTFVRFFFITLGSIYACCYILRTHISFLKRSPYIFLISLINGIIACFLNAVSSLLGLTVTIILIFMYMYVQIRRKAYVIFSATIISFGLGYATFIISCVFTTLFSMLFINNQNDYCILLLLIFSGILDLVFIFLLFRIKTFRKGMPFLYQSESSVGGVLLAFAILILVLVMNYFSIADSTIGLLWLLMFLLLGILLLSWWSSRVRRAYQEKLRMADLASLQEELRELKEECKRVREDNDSLARVIHKDNKMIPAMEIAVRNFVSTYSDQKDDRMRRDGDALTNQLEMLLTERQQVLSAYQKWVYTIPSTGIMILDAMLSLMEKRAQALKIKFHVRLGDDCSDITEHIATEDLAHLLSDLIENAIIAAKGSVNPSILIYLGKLGEHAAIEIADSGCDFPPMVYEDLGLQRHSTHLYEGGSGIGLMDVWKLKKKYRASLHIVEYAPQEGEFTKKITVMFDHKNHYIIETYRFDEIESVHLRGDMFVLQK